MVLNLFGFVGSAIWLLIIGEWRSVVAGLFITIAAPFFLGLAILPSLALTGPSVYFAKRGITIGVYFFSFLASIYIAALITAWCGGITFYFLSNVPSHGFWPMLIWSYGVATSPWTYMAQKDDSIGSMLAAFFAQVAFIVMMLSMAFGANLEVGAQVFGVVMAVEVLFHMRLLAEMQRSGAFRDI
jgi:hypothetical protein